LLKTRRNLAVVIPIKPCGKTWCNLGAIPTKTTKNRLFSESLFFFGALLGALRVLFFYKPYMYQRFAGLVLMLA